LLLGKISFVIFSSTFLEEDFSENFLFLLVRVVVLDIVVTWCIEYTIVIVVAIGISIP
jgi:hypothetical protein